ncbi:MAG: RNA polymerase sigma factor [Dehalococcoidia bacterium]|jgi:DNA-directed RNA polymerase specialized sigma24 family protein
MHTTNKPVDDFVEKIDRRALKRYALYLEHSNIDNAEDLLQDTIIRMIEKADKFDKNKFSSVTKWGISVMHNIFIDKKRSERREKHNTRYISEIEHFDHPDTSKEPKTLFIREKRKLAKSLISNDKQREVFVLRCFGLSYKDIADATKSTENQIKARIHDMKMSLMGTSDLKRHKEKTKITLEEECIQEFEQLLKRNEKIKINFALSIVSMKKNVEIDQLKVMLKPHLENLINV